VCDKCQHNREAAVAMTEQMSNADKSREFYRRQGECRERERIIKLLEEDCGCHDLHTCIAHSFIALIKGENK